MNKEVTIDDIIEILVEKLENGGTVRKSTVLNTDYLIYNADYDHETVKLRKARELKEKGSGIEILTTEEWKKLIDS